jgi:hypothetical protein
MDLSDHLPETLRQDGEFILSRGRHRRPGAANPPTILLVTPRAEHPALASLRRMEQEYALRAELDAGWAAQPLALVSHQAATNPMSHLATGPMGGRFWRVCPTPDWQGAYETAKSNLANGSPGKVALDMR